MLAPQVGPSLVGTYNTSDGAYGVTVVGDYAYIADGLSGLQIIDVSTPSSPSLVGTCDTPACATPGGNALGVTVVDNYAYVADRGLQIIDVSTPSSPSLVGTCATPACATPGGNALGVTVVDNYAYVADRGLQIIDVSIPSSPSLVDTYEIPGSASGVTIVGNYAYVADDTSGLQIIDISISNAPGLVGTYDTSVDAYEVTVVGNYAYVADWYSGLTIIDVSTPSSPSLVGTCDTAGEAEGVTVVGDYAYIAGGSSGLQIIDVSSPSSPSLVGTYGTPSAAYGVTVVGDYAYVADNASGLQIIDVSTPSSPSLVGTYDTPSYAHGVAIVGNYAYVADLESGLQIIGDIREGIQLEGTPACPDVGLLNLKVTASDGVDEASTTFSIDVINDAPTVTDVLKSGTEDTTLTFTESDFADHFIDDNEDDLTKIQITSLPDNGVLKLSSVNVTLDQETFAGDLGDLTFDPYANWNGNTSFTWKGYDCIESSETAANVNIQISSVNDAPIVSDVSKSGTEDTTVTFTVADFTSHFSDVEGESITKIQVTSLPDNGVLKLSGVDVTLDQEIVVEDLGNLTFDPNADWFGDTSFTWKGHDGTEYSLEAANVNIHIIDVEESSASTYPQLWMFGL